jgi:MFS family permease
VTLGCLGLALLVVLAFLAVERRARVPLVPLGIFRSRVIAVTNIVTTLSGAAFFGWFFFSPLYAQQILGFDSLQTGLTFLPATLTMAAFSLGLSAKIVARFGPKPPLVVGTLVFTVGLLLFARVPVDGAFIPDVLVPMFLLGIGSGMSFMPMFLIATAEATPAQAGLISGLVSTSQLIGGALGLALLAGLAAIRTGALLESGAAPPVALVGGFQAAFVLGAALSLITALLALTQLRGAQPSQESQPSRRDLIATVEA